MAKLLSLLTCSYYFCFLLLFFTCFCLAREVPTQHDQQRQFTECHLDTIDALEPDNRIESEAGLTETWNALKHPELRCAAVAILRRTINPNGLHLPSYVSYPELHFVDQGKGVIGMAIPGCAETFEEPQLQQRPHQQHQRDRHQKVRYIADGDVIAIPPGVPYWTYNYGENPLVIVTLQDTTNTLNQLDPTPTRFYIAGNPEKEHVKSESETRKGKKKERTVNNMFGGFDPSFLSKVLNVKEGLVSKLQSPTEQHKKQIIEVKGGLSIIRPPLEKEIRETEEEHQQHRRERREEEEEPRKGEHREWRRERTRRKEGEEEVVEEKGTETKTKTKTREQEEHKGGRRRHEEEEGEEEEEEETRTRRTREKRERHREGQNGQFNALEETVCTMKLHENLADPSRADIFNPRAGRVSTVNSLTLPILKKLQLSAEWVNLYKNGVYVPHWNTNANSVMYVTRGKGRVQVVNGEGESVFDGEVKRGQVVVVPQGFVVAKQAGSEGLEYVAFKTNDMAMISPLVGMNSAISGTPAEVLGHAFGLSPEEVRALKNNRKESILASPHESDEDAYISMV